MGDKIYDVSMQLNIDNLDPKQELWYWKTLLYLAKIHRDAYYFHMYRIYISSSLSTCSKTSMTNNDCSFTLADSNLVLGP